MTTSLTVAVPAWIVTFSDINAQTLFSCIPQVWMWGLERGNLCLRFYSKPVKPACLQVFSTASLGYSSRHLSLGSSVLVKVELTLSVVRVVDIVGDSHAQVSLTLRLYLIFEIHTSCSCMHGTPSAPLEISDGVICCCHCLTSAWPTDLSLAFETINVKSITWCP